MRAGWIISSLLGLLLGGCASMETAPTQEERQALAPTGKLRMAFVMPQPIFATRDPSSGELRGVVMDLGKDLARRLRVPLEVLTHPTATALLAGAQSGNSDIFISNVNTERARIFDLSAPFMQVELGYLAARGSSMAAAAEVDRPGVRIAVQQRGAADAALTAAIKNATLIRVPSSADALGMLGAGQADAAAGDKAFLFAASLQVPGSRVLEGRIDVLSVGIGVPKGRERGAAYVRKFIEEAKASGFVKASVDRAGVRGLVAAP